MKSISLGLVRAALSTVPCNAAVPELLARLRERRDFVATIGMPVAKMRGALEVLASAEPLALVEVAADNRTTVTFGDGLRLVLSPSSAPPSL